MREIISVEIMKRFQIHSILLSTFAIMVALTASLPAAAQDAKQPYPTMAPVEQYLMDRNAEIALARTAAPDSVSRDAEILVLSRHGFETAVTGKNGFVCIVGRGWSSAADPDFWNPKVRVPMCVNAPAANTYLLAITKITDLALAGLPPAKVNEAIANAFTKKELPPMESGAMCYMMGKQGYGGDVVPHWLPHLMFFYSDIDPAIWGANLSGSPVVGFADPPNHLTQFIIPTQQWSDGTLIPSTFGNKQKPKHQHK
jgi:hypothetical protein